MTDQTRMSSASNQAVGPDARALAMEGVNALKRGDALAARRLFEQIESMGAADASIAYAKAIACRRLNDPRAALLSIDVALKSDAANFQYLLTKADLLVDVGETKAASRFYLAASRAAEVGVEEGMESEVARAQGMCRRFADLIDDAVQARLRASNVVPSPRVREALDYLFARKVPYVSEPRFFRLPSLPSIPFYTDLSAWVQTLEAATDDIEAELRGVLRDRGAFSPYLSAPPDSLEARQNVMVNNPDWSACYLWRNGTMVEENMRRCPKTMEAISRIPLYQIPGRSPSVLFSLMRPGAHILPHNGLINSRLIGHLPLIVPERCSFRVGNDVREWKRGKVWLFDDTIEHEARNDSTELRVILIFEIARQDVRPDEHAAISQIFQALDSESGNAIRWEI